MGRGALPVLAGAALALALAAAPAGAAKPLKVGKPGGVVQIHKKGGSPQGPGYLTDVPQNPLLYFGGPVLRSNQTFAIFWDPAGKLSQSYRDLTIRYLQDVAADSGTTANVYSVLNQYYDTTGPIAYDSTYAGMAVDTDPYPTGGCPVSGQNSACITDAQLATELDGFLFAQGIARPANRAFMVFTPKGVQSCFDAEGVVCSGVFFCAYHGGFTGGHGDALYANLPFNAIPGCDPGTHPNGNDADPMLDSLSHEHREIIDDPLVAQFTGFGPPLAWYDPGGGESSDKCAVYYGTTRSTAFGRYNQVINGHPYLLQTDFSNALAAPQGFGCVADGVDRAPTARFTTSATGPTVTFDATSSSDPDPGEGVTRFFWDFGDFLASTGATPRHKYAAAGTYHVTLFAADDRGATAMAEKDVTVTNPTPAPAHNFKLDLKETIDSNHSEGAGNASGLGKVISRGFALFDYTDFPAAAEWDEADLEFAGKSPGQPFIKNDIVFMSDHVRVTDLASPPAGFDYALEGTWTIQGGTGAYVNAGGSGTVTGTCKSSFDSDIVTCDEHFTGTISGD